MNPNDDNEIPAHLAPQQHAPYPEKPKAQEDMEELAANVASGRKLTPAGYIDDREEDKPVEVIAPLHNEVVEPESPELVAEEKSIEGQSENFDHPAVAGGE